MVSDSIMFSSEYLQSVFIKSFCSLCRIGYFSVLVSLKLDQVELQIDFCIAASDWLLLLSNRLEYASI